MPTGPAVTQREADLEIAVEPHPEPSQVRTQRVVLHVEDVLPERIRIEHVAMRSFDLGHPQQIRGSIAGRPRELVLRAVRGHERLEPRVVRQPLGPLRERRDVRRQLPGCRVARGRPRGHVDGRDRHGPRRRVERMLVMCMRVAAWRRPDRRLDDLGWQHPSERRLGELLQRDGEDALREHRAVVRRRVVERRLPLRPQLQAVEAELAGEVGERMTPARVRRAAPDVLALRAREARVVDREHEALDAERAQGRGDELALRAHVAPSRAT